MFSFIFFISIICGIITAAIAYFKGRSAVGWFLAGLFLGIIGILLVVLLPKLKRCPQCGMNLRQDAVVCYYCGYDITEHLRQRSADEYKYCSNCERAVDKNAKTCPVCGAPLD